MTTDGFEPCENGDIKRTGSSWYRGQTWRKHTNLVSECGMTQSASWAQFPCCARGAVD